MARFAQAKHFRRINRRRPPDREVAWDPFKVAESRLERARLLMAQPATLDSYDWPLIVVLITDAHDALLEAKREDPSLHLPLFDEVIEELRKVTNNFSKPLFLESTKAARRYGPGLFTPRQKGE